MEKLDINLTPGQKKIAGILAIVIALGLLILFKPLIELALSSLISTIILVVVLIFVVLSRNYFMFFAKMLVWNFTKKAIGLDKIGVLEQSLRIAHSKKEKMAILHNEISATRVETERSIKELVKSYDENKNQAVALEKKAEVDPTKYKLPYELALHKVKADKDSLDSLIPHLEFIVKGADDMAELRELLDHKVTAMEYTVKRKKAEYESLKTMSKASNTLKEFLNSNTPEARMFEEGLAQTEKSISSFIATIENLEKDIRPTLTTMHSQKEGDLEEGRRLIEEYKQSLSVVDFEKTPS